MGKLLMAIGAIVFIIGLLLTMNISIPFLGRLPGDFVISGENYKIYFPLATSLIISLILSVLFYLFSK